MLSKRRKCSVCGRDLSGKNYARKWDEGQKQVVIVCMDDRNCYGSKMLKNYKTR